MRLSSQIITVFLSFSMCTQHANWRGAKRDGHFMGQGLLKKWPENGPETLLTVKGIGKGHSSAIMANSTIYITGMKDTLDYLSAIDEEGNIRWQVPYGRSWVASYPETYSSPTLEDDRIYVFSGNGQLACLNAESGKTNWKVNVDKEYEPKRRHWGVAESPLIVDDKVICTPCGNKTTVVAFNKYTGELEWESKSLHTEPSWTSPVLYEYNNFRFILAVTSEHLVAVDPEHGDFKWIYLYIKPEWIEPLKKKNIYYRWYNDGMIKSVLTNTPIFKEDEIFISKGYNYPSVMLKIDPSGESVTEKWINHTLDTHHGGFVEIDGFIYGSNWINNANGNWTCLDWVTGEVQYENKWHNKGSIITADGMLYCYEEKNGNLALVKPNPEKFEMVSSFKIDGKGGHWAHPSIFDGKLFVRHGDVLMAFNILESS